MNQQRPNWHDPAQYQPGRFPPPAKAPAPGSVPMYNPNHYTPPPSNGSWAPPKQLPPPQVQSKDTWEWDENVNNYQNYADQQPKAPAEFPASQPEHLANNNQYEAQPTNQNWGGWGDGEDWGWTADYQAGQQQETVQQPVEVYQPPASGLESSISAMTLSEPVPPQAWSDDTATWSRVPTWGSALDHGQAGSEQTYPLGERNTYVDGASFTDPSQPLARNGPVYQPVEPPPGLPVVEPVEPEIPVHRPPEGHNVELITIEKRLPGSGNRSQSGTPSMERENERPDAEGGYENDQPTPLYSQASAAPFVLPERKESPAGSRPASRQAGSTPSSETPSANPSPFHLAGPKGFYPPVTSAPSTLPRGSQEAVGSLPPSSQRMIPGSQVPIVAQQRPADPVTPVAEQRIVTGFAKNDPVPAVVPAEESRSPPPPHRSETIGSENPRANIAPQVGAAVAADRSDDRISTDRDRESKPHPHDRSTRVERERDRDDYDRDRRYQDDDEDERFSTSYRERDRRYDSDRDRDREHREPRRYPEDRERERGYSRDYEDDRRSAYGPSERHRADPRRRDPRRSDYYLTEAEMYERSGGRKSSLYDGDNDDLAGDFNRSAYGYGHRDGRRRDTDRSRVEDPRYYAQRDRPTGEVPERAISERDYRLSTSSVASRRRDPRDVYYQDPRYYGYPRDPAAAYDPYRAGYPVASATYNQYYHQQLTYAFKYNYPYFEELRLKNPAAYAEWYKLQYGQRYTPTVVGTGTALGSVAASEADRASVHSGRSSVNEDRPSMLANHSVSQQMRGSTTGLDQSHSYDYSNVFQEEDPVTVLQQDMTPHKFSFPHVIARFSPAGLLLRVLPNSPKDGGTAQIELHDLNVLLGDLPSAQDLKFFPGPLIPGQTHKQQVAAFCQQKIRRATDDSVDRQSYILLWEFLLLLLRQNGTIVGTDIAELLLKDHEILREPVIQEDITDSPVVDRTLVSRQTEASVTKKFRELLLFGNKKEALEWAMTQGLWGHALFLASKMDQRTYSSVMIRFANGLALTDPLQTLYQLMSGRQPIAVTSCGDDKWGDWRPHLAMILSNSKSGNSSDLDKKSIVTLGDTLAARGFLLASHFCYLVSQAEFGNYSNKTSKLVLLSSSAALPFDAFATNEAIQCTEVYEYARQLATPDFVIPSFQSYKFLYATRLAEHGRAAEALQYCEVIGNGLSRSPTAYSPALINQVFQLGNMLKYNDPQYLTENDGSSVGDPVWLKTLESIVNSEDQPEEKPIEEPEPVTLLPEQPQYTEQPQYYAQPAVQQPYYDPGQQQEAPKEPQDTAPQDYSGYSNPNYSWQQQPQQWNSYNEAVPTNGVEYWNPSNNMSVTQGDEDVGPSSFSAAGEPSYYNNQSSSSDKNHDDKAGKQENKSKGDLSKGQQGWLGGLFSKFKPKNQMKLPDDKNPTIVWDPVKGQWIDTSKDGEEEVSAPPPPPKDASFQSLPSMPVAAVPTFGPSSLGPPNEGNRFGLNKAGRGGRGGRNYVNPSNIKISSVSSPLLDTFATPSAVPPPQFFVPSPAPVDLSAPSDFVSTPNPDAGTSESGDRFMYNPTGAGRGGLASRGRYPR